MSKKNKKVAIAMSGGVDSSVAAALLVKQGYDCFGIFMSLWSEAGEPEESEIREKAEENKCCSIKNYENARRVCQKLGIKFYTLTFEELFKEKIVNNFLSEYQKGLTPNPCVRCNKYIKFGALLNKVKKMGADYLATGHYISLKHKNTKTREHKYRLFTAKDKEKDQSYFLYNLTQNQLKYLLFPIDEFQKEKVKKLAKKFVLPVVKSKESQEICFIAGKEHNEFLKKYLDLKPGKIVTMKGKVVGQHQGLSLYTIGQRRGVGLANGPYYVIDFDYQKNELIVTDNPQDKKLFKDELIAQKINWISGIEPKLPFKCLAKIRYRHPAVPVIIAKKVKGDYQIKFKEPQRAITPGQSVVFYKKLRRGMELLAGGIIK